MKLTSLSMCTPLVKRVMRYAFLSAFSGLTLWMQAQNVGNIVPDAATYNKQMAAALLLFTENRGQLSDKDGTQRADLLFTAHSTGAKIFLTATGIYYQFERMVYPNGYEKNDRKVKDRAKQEKLRSGIKIETARFMLSLQGANPSPTIRKEAQSSYTENFYLANCAISGVHTYQRLVYENVYPGIDWVIYSKQQHLEYDFIVHPGADPGVIKLKVTDAKKVSIAADGSLVMATELGEVKEAVPVSYCGDKKIVTAFQQAVNGNISFFVAGYDQTKALTIDPSVTWATYYGDSDYDYGYSCAADGSGNVYLAGNTQSTSGLASGGFQNIFGGGTSDGFLVKFSSSGSRLWATYYGGNDDDFSSSCATDASGNVYLAGTTLSEEGGIAFNGFQNTMGSPAGFAQDAFLVKFSPNGSRLWGTYYGGTDSDFGRFCEADASGNVYLTGTTYSTFSPFGLASGGFQNAYGGGNSDAFLVKFSSSGSRLWATYYGGSNIDQGLSCTVDTSDNVYMTGYTGSISGIASGGFQNRYSGSSGDAFMVKFSSSGSRLWATYYGGTGYDVGNFCAADASDNIYLSGYTGATTGIASGGFQNNYGGGTYDAFLVKFSSSGSRLWATYYGGSNEDDGYSCAVDGPGNVYLAGYTYSASGIASGGFQNIFGGTVDAFLVKFSSSGSRLWATYYGGSINDFGFSCAIDPLGNVYMAGYTASTSGIAFNGFQNVRGGYLDAFLAKIDGSYAAPTSISIANGNWNDPATWAGGVVPTATAVVIINTAVTVTANATCYSLTVHPPGSVTVSIGIVLTILH